jgi:sugar O-acyltransferase (sialic acid O-acetyltransferase NeuD family)
MINCVILGAGGHARVLMDALFASEGVKLCYLLDNDADKRGCLVNGVEIAGPDDMFPEILRSGITHFVVGLGSIGNNIPRGKLYEYAVSCGGKPLTVKAPFSSVSVRAELEDGAQVLAGAVISTGAHVGANSIINTGAIVEHDCVIGKHTHIAPGAVLSGMVKIGDYAHIGTGASVKQGVEIGEGAIVGAGAAVVKNVDAHTTVAGVPARLLKKG